MDTYAFESTRMNRLITSQEGRLLHLQNKRRKKVAIDSNEQFTNIADIVQVQEELWVRQAEFDARDRAKDARTAADEVVRLGIAPLLHQFHTLDSVDVATAAATL